MSAMSLYFLDTDILSLLRKGHPKVTARVAATPPNDLAVTIISVEEQISGWYRALRQTTSATDIARAYDRLTATVRFLSRLPIVSYDEPAILRARHLQSQKLNVRKPDLSIAAIALECRAIVVTRHLRDFGRVPGLVCDDWSI